MLAGAVVVAHFKAAPFGHFVGLFGRKRYAEPGIVGGALDGDVSLDLEFEQSAGPEEAGDFADVVFDDFAAGDVLKDDGGEGEVEVGGGYDGEVGAVVLVDVGVGKPVRAFWAWATISGLMSTAWTSPNRPARARVTRAAPQPISSTRMVWGSLPWQMLVMSVRISSATVRSPDWKNASSVQ